MELKDKTQQPEPNKADSEEEEKEKTVKKFQNKKLRHRNYQIYRLLNQGCRKIKEEKHEAELSESRYKKIKFFEKKKVIRKLKKLEKELKIDVKQGNKQELEEEKKKYKDYLIYIDNFPHNQKYLSLFPHQDSQQSKAKRQVLMDKILNTYEDKQKLQEKELMEADMVQEEQTKKTVDKVDSFFANIEGAMQQVEKKIVRRDGKIVGSREQLQSVNHERILRDKEQKQSQPEWSQNKYKQDRVEPREEKPQVPKINSSAYGVKGVNKEQPKDYTKF